METLVRLIKLVQIRAEEKATYKDRNEEEEEEEWITNLGRS